MQSQSAQATIKGFKSFIQIAVKQDLEPGSTVVISVNQSPSEQSFYLPPRDEIHFLFPFLSHLLFSFSSFFSSYHSPWTKHLFLPVTSSIPVHSSIHHPPMQSHTIQCDLDALIDGPSDINNINLLAGTPTAPATMLMHL